MFFIAKILIFDEKFVVKIKYLNCFTTNWLFAIVLKNKKIRANSDFYWRRRRDSDPRDSYPSYFLSREASSTT